QWASRSKRWSAHHDGLVQTWLRAGKRGGDEAAPGPGGQGLAGPFGKLVGGRAVHPGEFAAKAFPAPLHPFLTLLELDQVPLLALRPLRFVGAEVRAVVGGQTASGPFGALHQSRPPCQAQDATSIALVAQGSKRPSAHPVGSGQTSRGGADEAAPSRLDQGLG